MVNLYNLDRKIQNCKDNICIMDVMFEFDLLPIEQADILYKPPKAIENIYLSKVEGMLLGTIIGDVLGNKYESKIPAKKHHMDPIVAYPPKAHFTDDTQFTFWTLDVFLKEKWLNPESLAKKYIQERIIGIGKSIRSFIKRFKDLKYPWYLAGVKSAGNGALMKLSPVVIPHLINPTNCLWADAVVTTRLIYWDRLAISSAVAFTYLLWECFRRNKSPEPEWWLEKYVEITSELEGHKSKYKPRYPLKSTYQGPAWLYIEKVLRDALEKNLSLYDLSNNIGSGAYLLETIPNTLYVIMKYADNSLLALSKSVTYTKDSDTIGAIVGYIVGALNGVTSFPKHLLDPIFGQVVPKNFLNLIFKAEKFLARQRNVNYNGSIIFTSRYK